MLFHRCEVRESEIHGQGLHTIDPIPKGSLIIRWDSTAILTEEEFQSLCGLNNRFTLTNGFRFVGDLFSVRFCSHTPTTKVEWFLNHSFTPNMIEFLGCLFAAKGIAPGEELTLDYSLNIPLYKSTGDILQTFRDKITGRMVGGSTGPVAFEAAVFNLRRALFNGGEDA
jgi:SET domain-containing protein